MGSDQTCCQSRIAAVVFPPSAQVLLSDNDFSGSPNRHRHHLSATLLDGRAGNGWARLLRCGRDHSDGGFPNAGYEPASVMRRLSLNRSEPAKKSGQNIPKNRCRTTIPERMGETPAELPFIGDQVVCLSHDQAARSGLRKEARCRRIEIPGRRNGRPCSLARGFFVWNSSEQASATQTKPKQTRQRSTVAFAYIDLRDVMEVATAIHDHVGSGECD